MNQDRFQKAKRICGSALELEPDRREAFVEEACAGDESLRKEVESLLACQPEAQGPVRRKPASFQPRIPAAGSLRKRRRPTGQDIPSALGFISCLRMSEVREDYNLFGSSWSNMACPDPLWVSGSIAGSKHITTSQKLGRSRSWL
jgi:hypothetical protein